MIIRISFISSNNYLLGNGHVIQRLLTRGFIHLTGVDYSEKSIELARTQLGSKVSFHIIDMTDSHSSSSLEQYDIGIDKGTLDAILLCSADQRKAKRDAYIDILHRHIRHRLFLISCNWTRNELIPFFQPSESLRSSIGTEFHRDCLEFSLEREIETPTMSFGGRQGKTVTFLVLKREEE